MNDFEELITLREEQYLMMEKIACFKEDVFSIHGTKWDKIPKTEKEKDPTLKKFLIISEYEYELMEIYKEKKKIEDKILNNVKRLEQLEREVLKQYYIFENNIATISMKLSMSYGQVCRTKREALEHYNKLC